MTCLRLLRSTFCADPPQLLSRHQIPLDKHWENRKNPRGVGDYLRAITTPQRKLTGGEEGEEGGMAEALGASAGEQTKAVLVIPRGFPFQRVIDEIAENNKMDSYVGLVFERPFVDQD
ncbi:unnamed protein product [Durusdinium trenchii]|uniref:Uncharacterized protein n=1 Tax=Durusdinium trenchii TaxID=1381693 RepID=A0ABP0S3R3_9DINO